MKKIITLSLIAITTLMTGCADWQNKNAFKGGWLGSYEGDYIIVSESGGVVMDVWKLKDTFVSSPKNSDGWVFEDSNGDAIAIGGDVKIIRVKSSKTWDMYKEYHAEFETLSYREKFAKQ